MLRAEEARRSGFIGLPTGEEPGPYKVHRLQKSLGERLDGYGLLQVQPISISSRVLRVA